MMISNYITVEITRNVQVTYYKKLGYDSSIGDILNIQVSDMPTNSHRQVLVKCDSCGVIKYMKLETYNKITNNNSDMYYCSSKVCINKKRNLSNFKKYGYCNVFELEDTKTKIKNTNLCKFGCENPQQNANIKEKTEQTNISRYGVRCVFECSDIKNKIIETNIARFGFKYPTQCKNIIDKIKINNNIKYGVDWVTQNPNVYHNMKRASFEVLQYKNTDLYYQGSYELDFLNRYYDHDGYIMRGKSFTYTLDGKTRVYHSDFYIPSRNLIIEIKNSYLYNKDATKISAKEKSVTDNGFNYIIIIDKNYAEFNKLLI